MSTEFKKGGRYNWRGQPERLVYLGRNWSGNGWWHQFAKVTSPGEVWSEVTDSELHMLEETHEPQNAAHIMRAAPGIE
jgi:hypothetical protein